MSWTVPQCVDFFAALTTMINNKCGVDHGCSFMSGTCTTLTTIRDRHGPQIEDSPCCGTSRCARPGFEASLITTVVSAMGFVVVAVMAAVAEVVVAAAVVVVT